jgi:hypothetical protein
LRIANQANQANKLNWTALEATRAFNFSIARFSHMHIYISGVY